MTKATPKSATVFKTEDTVVPQRPTTTITIGSRSYDVRAPKMNVWMATGFMLERIEKGQAAQERLDSGDLIAVTERRELEEAVAATPAPEEIHELLIDGRFEAGRIQGGFLRRCLTAEDYQRLVAELDDEDSELDIPDLYQAAFELYQEFETWCVQRAEMMGLAAPKAKPGARRRTGSAAEPGTTRRRSAAR